MKFCRLVFSRFFIFWILLFPVFSSAKYVLLKIKSENTHEFSYENRTHVYVVYATGRTELGFMPYLSTLNHFSRMTKLFPKDQFLMYVPVVSTDAKELIGANSKSNLRGILPRLRKNILYDKNYVDRLMTTEEVYETLHLVKKIASFHFYGHGGVESGMMTDEDMVSNHTERWRPSDIINNKIADQFTNDAFVTLYGCNEGFIMGPVLAQKWHTTVMSTLTATQFEVLYKNGQYYANNQSFYTNYAVVPDLQYYAYRQRPEPHLYNGIWGKYPHGLPFFKTFCPTSFAHKSISSGQLPLRPLEECEIRLAKALLAEAVDTEPTVLENLNLGQFARMARDWLCPSGTYLDKQHDSCRAKLEKINIESRLAYEQEKFYSPIKGPLPKCNFRGCFLDINHELVAHLVDLTNNKTKQAQPSDFTEEDLASHSCLDNSDLAWKCANLPVQSKEKSSAFVDEYIHYLNGFKRLKGMPISFDPFENEQSFEETPI